MLSRIFAVVPVAALVVLVAPALAPAQQKVRYPRLHAALYELVKARTELQDAGGGFGGHKKKALAAIDDAIRSIRAGLAIKGSDPTVLVRKPEFYRQFKNYPHLRQVILDLREARKEVQAAKVKLPRGNDRIVRDIDVAIKQLRLAIDHAK